MGTTEGGKFEPVEERVSAPLSFFGCQRNDARWNKHINKIIACLK